MLPLAEACRAAASRCEQFSDAAALLRVWAQQQQLAQGADGLSGTLLTMLLVHLVEGGQAVSARRQGLSAFCTCLPAPAWASGCHAHAAACPSCMVLC